MKNSGSVLPLEVILGQSLLHECNLEVIFKMDYFLAALLKTITVVGTKLC